MRKRTIIIILAIFLFIPVTGNSSDAPQLKSFEDCVPLVSYVENQKDALSKADLQYFLSTFSNNHCINNVEFSEYGNEVLFSLMESNPNLFFEALFSLGQGQVKTIKAQINNPVDDSISVVKIYKAIESSMQSRRLANIMPNRIQSLRSLSPCMTLLAINPPASYCRRHGFKAIYLAIFIY